MKVNGRKVFLCFLPIVFILSACSNSEMIEMQLNEEIEVSGDVAYYASLEKEKRDDMFNEKHIEVSGIVSSDGYKLLRVGDRDEDGLCVSCTFSSSVEYVEQGDYVKLQGVCTGNLQRTMSVEGCEIIEHVEKDNIKKLVEVPEVAYDFKRILVSEIKGEFEKEGFENVLYSSMSFSYGENQYIDNEITEILINGELIDQAAEYSSKDFVEIKYADVPFAKEVTFGHYEQNNDGAAKEPIIWYAISTEENRTLLVSKNILDSQSFNDTTIAQSTSWENSTLRKWLNDSFYNEAFSQEEKKMIRESTVQDYERDRKLGGKTKDRVFVLSYKQAWKFFPTDEDRVAELTDYARTMEKYPSGDWWLIDSYATESYKYVVSKDGKHENSPRVNECAGVRPAMWVESSVLD